MSYSAEDEKRLLAYAAETTTQLADAQTTHHCSRRSACKRRVASVKRTLNFAATLFFVIACSVMVFGLSSLAIGTMRTPCKNHGSSHQAVSKAEPVPSTITAENAGPVVVADAAVPTTPASSFSRLIDAVSPDTLHGLLHEYFPDMYKHGVYPSEKSALEVIHRKNAALATSIAQLARRDLNSTSSASVPVSSAAVSSTPVSVLPSSSTPVTSSFVSSTLTSASSIASSIASSTEASSASGTTTATSHTTSSTTAAAATSTSKRVTSVYTSTINGTPTVVTATSVVGVAATNPTSTSTAIGSLQTGAAMPMLSGANAQLAKAVAGVVVGAMLI